MTTQSERSVDVSSSAPTRSQWLALLVIAGALILDVSSLAVINAALPAIGSDFRITGSTLQWTMTSYAVIFAGFLLFGGRAADVLGRRRIFCVGIALVTFAALAGALAPDVSLVIAARAVQGIGAALSGPAALALLTEVFPEGPARNKAMGIYGAVGAASFSGGMVVGGILTQWATWRSVFVFSFVCGIIVLVLGRISLPASRRSDRPLDVPGAILVTLGLGLVVFGLSSGGDAGWGQPTTIGSLVGAVILLTAFVVWESRVSEPLLPLGMFRSVPVRAGVLAAFLHYAAVIALLFFAPLYMQENLGYTPLESGLAIVPMGLAVIFVSSWTGRNLAKYGQRVFLVWGTPLIGLGILTWVLAGDTASYWALLPGILLMSVGEGTTFPALTAASLTDVPQHQHGVASAVNVTAQQVGSSIGVAGLVAVASAFAVSPQPAGQLPGYHAAYWAAFILTVVGAVALAVLMRRHGQRAAAAAPAEVVTDPVG
ncbi:MFS transporter [Kutzneria kofuensis]|uniref:EmrB/QacA subfamily drug resistance transporter n=1 Tax=Kutzneria kofuensis TaxID=103725 RepID=A0A7W9NFX1_9PSEU|nr:MFS transporter [Kutzneria kofuensis]MBB5890964.1 EmrB/QacA subfamily drug resistance transporter [Kutzneria kofuensis]